MHLWVWNVSIHKSSPRVQRQPIPPTQTKRLDNNVCSRSLQLHRHPHDVSRMDETSDLAVDGPCFSVDDKQRLVGGRHHVMPEDARSCDGAVGHVPLGHRGVHRPTHAGYHLHFACDENQASLIDDTLTCSHKTGTHQWVVFMEVNRKRLKWKNNLYRKHFCCQHKGRIFIKKCLLKMVYGNYGLM